MLTVPVVACIAGFSTGHRLVTGNRAGVTDDTRALSPGTAGGCHRDSRGCHRGHEGDRGGLSPGTHGGCHRVARRDVAVTEGVVTCDTPDGSVARGTRARCRAARAIAPGRRIPSLATLVATCRKPPSDAWARHWYPRPAAQYPWIPRWIPLYWIPSPGQQHL
jgi:hypothetical protein